MTPHTDRVVVRAAPAHPTDARTGGLNRGRRTRFGRRRRARPNPGSLLLALAVVWALAGAAPSVAEFRVDRVVTRTEDDTLFMDDSLVPDPEIEFIISKINTPPQKVRGAREVYEIINGADDPVSFAKKVLLSNKVVDGIRTHAVGQGNST